MSRARSSTEKRRIVLDDGREVVIQLEFREVIDFQGRVVYRRLVDRKIVGEIRDDEAVDLARQLGWISSTENVQFIDAGPASAMRSKPL